MLVSHLLDAMSRLAEESEVLDLGGVLQVDQYADALAGLGVKDGVEQALEAKGGKIHVTPFAFSSGDPDVGLRPLG
jgi:hypothetical protein